jgi:hypothetical protein
MNDNALFSRLHTTYPTIEPPRSSILPARHIPRTDVSCPSKFRRELNIRTCPLATHSNTAAPRARTRGTLKLPSPIIRLLRRCTACRRVGGNLACRSSEERLLCRYVGRTLLLPPSKCRCARGSARTALARARRDHGAVRIVAQVTCLWRGGGVRREQVE